MDEALLLEPEAEPVDIGPLQFLAGPDGLDCGLIPGDEMGWDETAELGDDYLPPALGDFNANLAEMLPEGKRDFLAQTIIKWVGVDRNSRKDWELREAAGVIALGVTSEAVGGLAAIMPGTGIGSDVTHPGLAQAQINFWARSYGELWQGGRPAKAIVLGATDAEREAQGKRWEDYVNYLYAEEMPSAAAEMAHMLYWLPISGSKFRKPYYDPIEQTITVETIATQDFIKPYSAKDLRKATRFTHVTRMTRNDLRRLIAEGHYLDAVRNRPDAEATEHSALQVVMDDAAGRAPEQDAGEHETEFDQRDVLYECSCYLDLADYGWKDPEGEPFGLPYVVTVHKTDQKVLSVRRNWRPGDLRKRRRLSVIEYKFLPGDGYGYGLLHIAGGLAMAQTGFLRYLLDACELDTTGRFSGFISQDIVGVAAAPKLKWGEFVKIPASAEEIRKAIWTPDYKWSPNNVTTILEYLDRLMNEIVSSTQSMVGNDIKDVPVGTILAIIEQKTKPFVTIFSLLHASFKEELKCVSELAADYMPQRYPYAVVGADQEVFASDFDDTVDIAPASDPNVVTALARNAQAQAVLEMVRGDPEVFGLPQRIAAYERFFEVLRVQNYRNFMPAPKEPTPPPQADKMQAEMQPAPVVDPVAADVARKDAQAGARIAATRAEIARKDAEAQARIDREASRMAIDPAAQRRGDAAIQQQEQNAEIAQLQQEILRDAEARRANLAAQSSVTGVI